MLLELQLLKKSTTSRRKVNPSRARRSMLRLEMFNKKIEAKKNEETQNQPGNQDVGVKAAGNSKQLLLELDKNVDGQALPDPQSPILQVDGEDGHRNERTIKYTFVSDYGEEDILDSLETQFPAGVRPTMFSQERTTPLGADRFLCN